MAEVFKGLRNAAVFERGVYLSPGQYELQIDKCLIKDTRKSGIGFIVEATVTKTSDEKNHPVGSKCTWFQGMRDKDVAFGSLKLFLYAALGLVYGRDKEKIAEKVDPNIESILYKACEKSDLVPEGENALKGTKVAVRTYMKKTVAKGLDFTNHEWSPIAAEA